jgi:hypothetical protein
MRLQLRPWHIHAMLKTHTRLTGYSAAKLKSNMDYLQEENLAMQESKDMQSLLPLMPSLLGVMGIQSSLLPKIELLEYEVGKNTASKYIQNSPILLTLSMENFRV